MIILKTTLSFFMVLVLAKLLGKKQMSQMTFFNYVTGITLGSLAANVIANGDNSIIEELMGLTWWCVLTGFIGFLTLKSSKLKNFFEGQPVILIKNGVFEIESMKKTKMNIEDLLVLLREQNIFSILEVDYAILEPSGELSVLKKHNFLNPTNDDMKIPTYPSKNLPCGVIMDSSIVYKSLKELDLSVDWLEKEMKNQNISSIEEIFYAEVQDNGSLYIIKR